MRKVMVVFGLGVLLFGLSLGQVGSAQMQMGAQPSDTLPQEIHLLKVINQAGLTKAQLDQFQGLLSRLREAQQAIVQSQQALKAFLLSWQGSPEEFSAALQPLEAQVQQANQSLKQQQQSVTVELKNLLSYFQGETLFGGLGQTSGTSSRMSGTSSEMSMDIQGMMQQMKKRMEAGGMQGQGAAGGQQMSNQQMGPSNMAKNDATQMGMQSMMQMHRQMMARMQNTQMGSRMNQANWGALLTQHLELLDRVVSEKAASL